MLQRINLIRKWIFVWRKSRSGTAQAPAAVGSDTTITSSTAAAAPAAGEAGQAATDNAADGMPPLSLNDSGGGVGSSGRAHSSTGAALAARVLASSDASPSSSPALRPATPLQHQSLGAGAAETYGQRSPKQSPQQPQQQPQQLQKQGGDSKSKAGAAAAGAAGKSSRGVTDELRRLRYESNLDVYESTVDDYSELGAPTFSCFLIFCTVVSCFVLWFLLFLPLCISLIRGVKQQLCNLAT